MCTTENCDRKPLARGLCPTHYSAWWRVNNTTPEVTCELCSTTFRKRATGQRFCTSSCQRRYASIKKNEWRGSTALVRYQPPPRPHTQEPTVIKGVWHVAGYCIICSAAWVGETTTRVCSEGCRRVYIRGVRRQARHARRARERSAFDELVNPLIVHKGTGWICGLCNQAIDPTLPPEHNEAASIDHIVPLARGGRHNYSNVQSAHRICNSRKGARLDPRPGAPTLVS